MPPKHWYLSQQYRNELDPDLGSDLGGGGGGEEATETPAYFVGELDEPTVVERLKYAGDLPERLNAMESRFGERLSPLAQRLEEIQKNLGTQVGFTPKFDRFTAAVRDYDPKMAETFLPALIDDLRDSLKVNPLDGAALSPYLEPMMQQHLAKQSEATTTAMLDMIGIDPVEIVNRDQQGNPIPPATELQKQFQSWWELQDEATRKALAVYDIGYARAMHRFSKWREKQVQEKGAATGALSSRLASGQQVSAGGRRAQPAGPKSEKDAFDAGFNQVMAELKRGK